MSDLDIKTHIEMPNAERLLNLPAGRRAFLSTVGLAAGFASLGVSGMASSAMAAGPTDAQILNFALNLEYLEAEFYLRAALGRGLAAGDVTGTGDAGGVTGGRKVPFVSGVIKRFAEEIANDEENHVRFLRSALGGARVARPKIDLKNSFTAAARAAGLVGPSASFDPYLNDSNFLLAAFIFEDVGVTAYKGAARLIDNPDYLEAAAGILAVEAYHAATIRTLLYQRGLFNQARAISDLRDSVDGNRDIDKGIGTKDSANIVPTDRNGIAFSRSPAQVLKIVYLGGTDQGGFYPQGLNGAVASA